MDPAKEDHSESSANLITRLQACGVFQFLVPKLKTGGAALAAGSPAGRPRFGDHRDLSGCPALRAADPAVPSELVLQSSQHFQLQQFRSTAESMVETGKRHGNV